LSYRGDGTAGLSAGGTQRWRQAQRQATTEPTRHGTWFERDRREREAQVWLPERRAATVLLASTACECGERPLVADVEDHQTIGAMEPLLIALRMLMCELP
jgi:hypothetical protein